MQEKNGKQRLIFYWLENLWKNIWKKKPKSISAYGNKQKLYGTWLKIINKLKLYG